MWCSRVLAVLVLVATAGRQLQAVRAAALSSRGQPDWTVALSPDSNGLPKALLSAKEAASSLTSGYYINVTKVQNAVDPWRVQLRSTTYQLDIRNAYTMSFMARASKPSTPLDAIVYNQETRKVVATVKHKLQTYWKPFALKLIQPTNKGLHTFQASAKALVAPSCRRFSGTRVRCSHAIQQDRLQDCICLLSLCSQNLAGAIMNELHCPPAASNGLVCPVFYNFSIA